MNGSRGVADRAPRWLLVALLAGAALIGLAAALHLFAAPADAPPLPARLFAVLVAAAFYDVALLARRRAPGLAWFATAVSTGLAAVECSAALRAAGVVRDDGSTVLGLAVAVASLLAAAAVGLADAARPRLRPPSAWNWVGVAAVAMVAAASAVAAAWTMVEGAGTVMLGSGAVKDEVVPLRVAGRLSLLTVMLGLGVGGVRDLQPGLARAWRRWRDEVPGRSASLVDILSDELLPWRTASQVRVRESERERLAADLHAFVLPDLRRAAAAAASPGAPEDVRAGVRRALEDVERLMHERQSIVLEEFGLVAALEWLAERTEQGGSLRVELELEGDRVDRRDSVSPEIARAAFRIAMLALDNVVRHAAATTATVRLRVDAGAIEMAISDDGHGARERDGGGGRGLADMRREAAATGGSLRTVLAPGVTIEAAWPAR